MKVTIKNNNINNNNNDKTMKLDEHKIQRQYN